MVKDVLPVTSRDDFLIRVMQDALILSLGASINLQFYVVGVFNPAALLLTQLSSQYTYVSVKIQSQSEMKSCQVGK
jgi:hypothetical protein